MFAEPCIIYLLFANIIGIHTVDNALLQSSVLSPFSHLHVTCLHCSTSQVLKQENTDKVIKIAAIRLRIH